MRMKFLNLVAVLGLASIWAVPAHADWQYTSWGMSPAKVVEASNGNINLSSGREEQQLDGYTIGASGTYTAGKRTFEATFYFQNGGLALVKLDSEESPRCYDLANDLKGVYGKQFSQSRSSILNIDVWHDRENNNFIGLTAIGDTCGLTYKPLISESSKGL